LIGNSLIVAIFRTLEIRHAQGITDEPLLEMKMSDPIKNQKADASVTIITNDPAVRGFLPCQN
jgi:hypothetical protein